MEYSDLDLVRGIKAGDKQALDLLVRRWYPQVFRYVFKLLRNEQDSYDITQEVFLSMMQNLSGYRPWKRFENWLFTIAHNKCIDHFRAQKRWSLTNGSEADQPSPGLPLEDAVANSVVVREALDRLPAVQREAAILHYCHQFTAKEIAQLTDTPLPTVKSRLKSAKKALSQSLQEGYQ